jgi:radical SAM protein with 4Fe4S-binding SPASM domain
MPFNKTGLSKEGAGLAPEAKPGHGKDAKARKPCFLLWRFLVVHYDGTVVPCCMDFTQAMPIGNIMERPLKELWNGKTLRKLRELHIQGRYDEIPLCRDCSIPSLSAAALLGTMCIDTITIKKKILPMVERLWLVKKFKIFGYYED